MKKITWPEAFKLMRRHRACRRFVSQAKTAQKKKIDPETWFYVLGPYDRHSAWIWLSEVALESVLDFSDCFYGHNLKPSNFPGCYSDGSIIWLESDDAAAFEKACPKSLLRWAVREALK